VTINKLSRSDGGAFYPSPDTEEPTHFSDTGNVYKEVMEDA